MAQRIMILATDGFEQSELVKPKKIFEDAGYETVVVSPDSGQIKGWDQDHWGDSVDVDLTLDEATSGEFDAIVMPGGQINPDKMRLEDKAVELVRSFNSDGKPVAAICHAPWLLIEAGIVEGKTVTSWPSVRTDLKNAGGNVVDKEVAVDGNIITSRKPDDIPAFANAVMDMLKERMTQDEMATA
ncbi:type 1 glutamine amidotransferase domain-containing protein [Aurantiacibacter spongiae]|uniref:Type 1 glutamine amidotransferase n=1 Tax=Aurantiacibacter spongiae TaxID=2488860 RepID=A0A3N5DKW5_9SPHN|nr:type 1 glutamine amidotransferase domain-containing protein [Aurantiacibacter spongiae]RPF72352.1 type 1 glutamine amidotransferase [Aurantiacibacter spongiae]